MNIRDQELLNANQLFAAIDHGELPNGADARWDNDDDLRILVKSIDALDERSLDALLSKLKGEVSPGIDSEMIRDNRLGSLHHFASKRPAFGSAVNATLMKYCVVGTYVSGAAAVVAIIGMLSLGFLVEAPRPEIQVRTHQQFAATPSFEDMWPVEQAGKSKSGSDFSEQLKAYEDLHTSQNLLATKSWPPSYYFTVQRAEQGDGKDLLRNRWQSCLLIKHAPYICEGGPRR